MFKVEVVEFLVLDDLVDCFYIGVLVIFIIYIGFIVYVCV